MTHVVLLGDSIFDNAAYVPGESPVSSQLEALLPDPWRVSLLAVDGHVTENVHAQLRGLPADATHLVVSCGGNDALGWLDVLEQPVNKVIDALHLFARIRSEFRQRYHSMLTAVTATGCRVAACTVYDSIPTLTPAHFAALALFNELILRETAGAGIKVIDLRVLCDAEGDYSTYSPIEPSSQGGAKIAHALAEWLQSE